MRVLFCSFLAVAFVELRADGPHDNAQDMRLLEESARMISRFVDRLSKDELQAGAIQTALKEYDVEFEDVDGAAIVAAIASKVSDYIRSRAEMVLKMKELIERTADDYDPEKMTFTRVGCTSVSSATLEWTSRDRESTRPLEPVRFVRQSGFNNLRVSENYSQSVHFVDDRKADLWCGTACIKTAAAVCHTKELEVLFSGISVDIDTRWAWTYFAHVSGVSRWFPGFRWTDVIATADFLPQFRPWYLAATGASRISKRVVFVVDGSASMQAEAAAVGDAGQATSVWLATKSAIKKIIAVLSPVDWVDVVVMQGSRVVVASKAKNFTGCTLLPLRLQTKDTLRLWLDSVNASDERDSNFQLGIQTAFDLIRAHRANEALCKAGRPCESLLLFYSNGYSSTDVTSRTRRTDVVDFIVSQYSLLSVRLLTFAIGVDVDWLLLNEMACASQGLFQRLNSQRDQISLRSYALFFNVLQTAVPAAERTDLAYSDLYEDAGGLGLVFTISAACFSPSGDLIGVAATDVPMQPILELLSMNSTWNSNNALVNRQMATFAHPMASQLNSERAESLADFEVTMQLESSTFDNAADAATASATTSPSNLTCTSSVDTDLSAANYTFSNCSATSVGLNAPPNLLRAQLAYCHYATLTSRVLSLSSEAISDSWSFNSTSLFRPYGLPDVGTGSGRPQREGVQIAPNQRITAYVHGVTGPTARTRTTAANLIPFVVIRSHYMPREHTVAKLRSMTLRLKQNATNQTHLNHSCNADLKGTGWVQEWGAVPPNCPGVVANEDGSFPLAILPCHLVLCWRYSALQGIPGLMGMAVADSTAFVRTWNSTPYRDPLSQQRNGLLIAEIEATQRGSVTTEPWFTRSLGSQDLILSWETPRGTACDSSAVSCGSQLVLSQSIFRNSTQKSELIAVLAIRYNYSMFHRRLWELTRACSQASNASGIDNAHCFLVDDRGYVVAVSSQPNALAGLKLPLMAIDPLLMAALLESQVPGQEPVFKLLKTSDPCPLIELINSSKTVWLPKEWKVTTSGSRAKADLKVRLGAARVIGTNLLLIVADGEFDTTCNGRLGGLRSRGTFIHSGWYADGVREVITCEEHLYLQEQFCQPQSLVYQKNPVDASNWTRMAKCDPDKLSIVAVLHNSNCSVHETDYLFFTLVWVIPIAFAGSLFLESHKRRRLQVPACSGCALARGTLPARAFECTTVSFHALVLSSGCTCVVIRAHLLRQPPQR